MKIKTDALRDKSVLGLKILLLAFILVSPMVHLQSFKILNAFAVKLVFVAVILVFCFVDFQLALIATIALLVLIIHMNNNMLSEIKTRMDTFVNSTQPPKEDPLQQYFPSAPPRVPSEVDMQENWRRDANFVCPAKVPTDINNDMFTHFIDDKIKPYDVFISMLTNEENIQKAQGVF